MKRDIVSTSEKWIVVEREPLFDIFAADAIVPVATKPVKTEKIERRPVSTNKDSLAAAPQVNKASPKKKVVEAKTSEEDLEETLRQLSLADSAKERSPSSQVLESTPTESVKTSPKRSPEAPSANVETSSTPAKTEQVASPSPVKPKIEKTESSPLLEYQMELEK